MAERGTQVPQEVGGVQMSEKMDELIEIVKHMEKQQHILAKMIIHLGCRADLYDDFIRGCFDELENLKVPELKEADK